MSGLPAILWTGVGLSFLYAVAAHWCFERWGRECGGGVSDATVSFLRPLKGGVPELWEKLVLSARAMAAGDQIVLGVDAGGAEAALGERLRAAFPERDIVVVECAPGVALNPKISKLAQMSPHARHEHWVIADSEALLEAKFVAGFRAEWMASGADALTAGYRVCGARSWPQRLDAAAVLLTLWPGLAVLRACGPLKITLGACTGLRRGDLAGIGGWEMFGGELAEDNRLGAALAATGRTIRLSAHVVALECDGLGWRDWWRHQRRVAVTYRAGNPLGFAGSIVTHGELWCVLLGVAGVRGGWAMLAVAWALRAALAARMARRLDFSIPTLPPVVLLASLAASAAWLASWCARSVWWGGKWRRVTFRGRFTGGIH